jgi:predicted metal-dependent enzyme (double-stranded beta helix superfamily)/rhodanese-related sulfurtransferase
MSALRPIPKLHRLADFVGALGNLVDQTNDEDLILAEGGRLLAGLIARDDWLPDAYAQPDPTRYQQYLLHCDSRERFSVVSFVWGPGQATPVHDHTVWGLVGVLRGAELSQRFERRRGLRRRRPVHRLERGEVEAVSPTVGDVHQVTNAFDDRVSISIHVYGANIGAVQRSTYDAAGRPKRFVSGYANTTLPNLWDRSNPCWRRSTHDPAHRHPARGPPGLDRPPRDRPAGPARGRPVRPAHPLFASQLPLSRLELEILDRVPRKDAKIVLYDNGEGLVSPAGKRLAALGYTQIRALAGGLQGWKDAGYELFQDVNSYSKAFGELVEARRHTPSLPAQEVQARIDQGADQVILDSRRFEEYAVMSIPAGSARPAPSWCCGPASWRPIRPPRSSSTAPAAPAA